MIGILFYRYKLKFIKNKNIHKRDDTLELIEALIIMYNKITTKKNKQKLNLLYFHQKINKRIKLSFLKDDLQLYLLRNLLYRILNKCITQSNIRKLVKMEILRAPEGTFSDFVNLFDELKQESKFVS